MPGFGMNGGQQPVAVSGFNPMPQMWAFTSECFEEYTERRLKIPKWKPIITD